MAYATVDDVKNILPDDEEPIPDPAPTSLAVGLEEATDLVIGFLGFEYEGTGLEEPDEDGDGVPDDVPGAVRRVVARVTLRALLTAAGTPGVESEVNLMGPFSHTFNWSKEAQSGDFYLTNSDEQRLEPFKRGYSGVVMHMPMAAACWYDT